MDIQIFLFEYSYIYFDRDVSKPSEAAHPVKMKYTTLVHFH